MAQNSRNLLQGIIPQIQFSQLAGGAEGKEAYLITNLRNELNISSANLAVFQPTDEQTNEQDSLVEERAAWRGGR